MLGASSNCIIADIKSARWSIGKQMVVAATVEAAISPSEDNS